VVDDTIYCERNACSRKQSHNTAEAFRLSRISHLASSPDRQADKKTNHAAAVVGWIEMDLPDICCVGKNNDGVDLPTNRVLLGSAHRTDQQTSIDTMLGTSQWDFPTRLYSCLIGILQLRLHHVRLAKVVTRIGRS
jgi:hypothetical protein